jgi:hypothetical protein
MNSILRHVCFIAFAFLLLSGTASAADYIVSGAAVAEANGMYVQNGVSEGVPKYTKGAWTLGRELIMGQVWVIRSGPGFGDISYFNWLFPSPDLPPNDHNWEQMTGGTDTGLTITLASGIPSLGTWGVLIMIALLIGAAIAVIRKNHLRNAGGRA